MSNKDRAVQLAKYMAYIILGGVLWGVLMYFVYTWLAGYSLTYAYLGNLALIIVALAADEYIFKLYDIYMQSEEYLAAMKKSRFFRFFLDAYISFKGILYLFYILIMICSQIIDFNASVIPEGLGRFISANEYSVLLLIAIDLFSGQFRKDKRRRNGLSEKFEKLIAGKRDE